MMRTDVHRFVGLEAVSWRSFHLIASVFQVMCELRLSVKNEEKAGEMVYNSEKNREWCYC